MMKVGSIMTVDLLISDKPSVSKLCGYRLHSVRPSLDQLDDESATNQIGRSWFWGALFGNLLYRGEPQVSTCRRHMYMQGQRRCCVPWSRTNGDSTWWNETFRKSMLGHTSIIMTYFGSVGYFLFGDGDEVRHNKISIDSLYSCTDEQRKRPLTWRWVVLGVCGVLWFRCSHRGRGTSQGCS